jgi:glycosyltransferase involved in cell wall biosynthesis
LFVGRLQESKRVDLLIQACANLPAAIQPVLVIVGDGPDRSRLEKLASSIYPETRFTGHLVGIALDTWFNEADLFVLPGTGGLAVQQAMSFGLPVVVAEGDGTQSDLVRAGNGWQIQPGSLDELRATLQGALIDRAILNKMGEESYRIVKEEVNLVRMADIFVQALRVGNRT